VIDRGFLGSGFNRLGCALGVNSGLLVLTVALEEVSSAQGRGFSSHRLHAAHIPAREDSILYVYIQYMYFARWPARDPRLTQQVYDEAAAESSRHAHSQQI
jgi:hypothetical protein